jgi:hypothetical protein
MEKTKKVKKGVGLTPKKAKKTKKSKVPVAAAIHAHDHDGEHHLVGIGNLRVIITPDDNAWFAQGLEIDYAVQGDSMEDAKKQFEDGLAATIEQHLIINGHIKQLLRVAPPEAWRLLHEDGAWAQRFSHVSTHHIIKDATKFDGIDYLSYAAGVA